jgi:hypothetical protein
LLVVKTHLVKLGEECALVLDDQVLKASGIDETTPLQVSNYGDVIVVAPERDPARVEKLKSIMEEAHAEYGEVFKKLAD